MNRFFNIFVNKIVNVLIIVILILIAFFLGLNTANALEATMWGTEINNVIDSLTSTTTYNYSDYNSDSIRDFIYERSNEQFFDNTYGDKKEFFRDYTYVVMAYSQTTIRVFVQNINRVIDYQGFQTMPVEPIFFMANIAARGGIGAYSQYQAGVNVIYSYFIDINYNTLSYTFSDDNPLTNLEFYLLDYDYKERNTSQKIELNMELIDSFNGRFAWIETWAASENTQSLWLQACGNSSYYGTIWANSIIDFPELQYVSSGVPEEPGDNPGDEGNDSNDNAIIDSIDKIFDWLNGDFDGYEEYDNYFNNFITTDNNGISRIITSPLALIRGLLNSNNICMDLQIDFAFLGKDKVVYLPNGCILWNNVPYSVEALWHMLLVGLFGYRLLIYLFHVIEDLKDPEESKVNTLDL